MSTLRKIFLISSSYAMPSLDCSRHLSECGAWSARFCGHRLPNAVEKVPPPALEIIASPRSGIALRIHTPVPRKALRVPDLFWNLAARSAFLHTISFAWEGSEWLRNTKAPKTIHQQLSI